MSTPNTPTPGSPEWLRAMSDCNARCDRDEDAQGLRAAAERIEELERKIKTEEDWWEEMHAYRERAEEAEAELARLRADRTGGFHFGPEKDHNP